MSNDGPNDVTVTDESGETATVTELTDEQTIEIVTTAIDTIPGDISIDVSKSDEGDSRDGN